MRRTLTALIIVLMCSVVPASAGFERRSRIGPAVSYHYADLIEDAYDDSLHPINLADFGAVASLGVAITHIEPLWRRIGLLAAIRIATPLAIADEGSRRPLSDYRAPRVIGDAVIGVSRVYDGRRGALQADVGGGLYFVNMVVKSADASIPTLETHLMAGLGLESSVSVPLRPATDLYFAGSLGYAFFPASAGTRRTRSVIGAAASGGIQLRY